MYKYAQIEISTGRCVSVSFLSDEVEAEDMIPLGETDNVSLGDVLNADGTWTPAPPPDTMPQGETAAQKLARIEQENADMRAKLAEANENITTLYEMILFPQP